MNIHIYYVYIHIYFNMYPLLKNNLNEVFYGLLEFFPIIILFLSTMFLMLVGRITSNQLPTRKIIIILKIQWGWFLPTSASVYSGTAHHKWPWLWK